MKLLISFILLANSTLCFGQDDYIQVSAINNNILRVSNLQESTKSFKVHERVLLIQMENNGAPGGLVKKTSNSEVARKYIVVTITDVEYNDGAVSAIKVSRCLQNEFIIGSNASVHL